MIDLRARRERDARRDETDVARCNIYTVTTTFERRDVVTFFFRKKEETKIKGQMMVMEPPLREICSRKIKDTATAYVPETAPKGS